VPLGIVGRPEDIFGIALFLASELSAHIAAEAIFVGGELPRLLHGATINGQKCRGSKLGK